MNGSHEVIVGNARIQYKFTIERNITIVRGKSATGKTTLIDLIADYEENGASSGAYLRCDKPCTVLRGRHWERDLQLIEDSIVFIDEGSPFITDVEFARAIRHTSNYYVIATRARLPYLPYSVEEVYEIHNTTRRSSKYVPVKRLYSSFRRIYGSSLTLREPQIVIVEDSRAGFQFFKAICDRLGICCESANGKSNVFAKLKEHSGDIGSQILVIADGAAFGSEMDLVDSLHYVVDFQLFLPESFEWLVLDSGVLCDEQVKGILGDPASFIDSEKYFSWEEFFTELLRARSRGSYLEYKKRRLNKAYLQERESNAIRSRIPVPGIGKLDEESETDEKEPDAG